MARVIGLVGLTGTGKSEASRLLARIRPMPIVYFGDVVLSEMKRRGLDGTPDNERLVREQLRATEGMAVMARRKMPEIAAGHAGNHDVLVDGVYSYSELLLLREKFGDDLTIIAIHAARSVRAERLARREVRPLSLQEMDARDEHEIRTLEKAPPIALADYHIVNDGSAEALESELRAIISRLG